MRVIAGSAGGRHLVSPRRGTRPTTDRVREAIFSSLESMGRLEGSRVVDLFSGSGALGIEALSRGAASVVFVERDPATAAVIRRNLELTGFGSIGAEPVRESSVGADQAVVVTADAVAWVARARDGFDLAFADPPYGFDRWGEILGALDSSMVVAESGGPLSEAPGWEVLKARRYGGTVVTMMRREPTTGGRAR